MHDIFPIRHEAFHRFDRREMLALIGLSAVSLVAGDVARSNYKSKVTAYLPTWLPDGGYRNIQANIGEAKNMIDRVHLAFANFDMTNAKVGVPILSPGLREFIHEMRPTTDLSLSLGGDGDDVPAWQTAWENHTQYGKSVDDARIAIEDIFQRPVHIDIDCESDISSTIVTQITQAVHDSLSDQREISMAVPASHQLNIYDTRPTKLGDIVDTFHVMTYDQYGPWSEVAGPVASGTWTLESIHNWVQKSGDAAKLEVGYPAYGYQYLGANHAGDTFLRDDSEQRSVLYVDMPESAVQDDPTLMTSEVMIDDMWTSCLSPRMIGSIATRLFSLYPSLGGSFFWSLDGMKAEHLKAVGPR